MKKLKARKLFIRWNALDTDSESWIGMVSCPVVSIDPSTRKWDDQNWAEGGVDLQGPPPILAGSSGAGMTFRDCSQIKARGSQPVSNHGVLALPYVRWQTGKGSLVAPKTTLLLPGQLWHSAPCCRLWPSLLLPGYQGQHKTQKWGSMEYSSEGKYSLPENNNFSWRILIFESYYIIDII